MPSPNGRPDNHKLKRFLWPGAVALAIAAGLFYSFRPQAVSADIALVDRGPLSVTVEDDGITRVRDVYLMSAPVAGVVERIDVEAGDAVAANTTVIARLRPVNPVLLDRRTEQERRNMLDAARAAEAQARAEVDHQDAELQLATAELDRLQKLKPQGFVSEADLDRARTAVRSLQSGVERVKAALRQRQFDVKTAQAALQPNDTGHDKEGIITLRAPIDGRVLRRLVESEQVVAAGAPLVELGNANDLEVVIDFLSRDAVRVTPGDAAEIRRWGGDGVLQGKVRTVEPFGVLKVSSLGIEEQRVNVVIDFTDPPAKWQRLGHGYQVEAAVILWHSDKVLRVPLSALFRKGEDWVTFKAEGGRARLVTLKIGHLNGDHAEVLDGLQEGDHVVLNPGTHIVDGVHVANEAGNQGTP